MKRRHCPGHKFTAATWDGRPILGRWKCRICGLKVSTRQAAEALEGQAS
jgi:hypothetical protein